MDNRIKWLGFWSILFMLCSVLAIAMSGNPEQENVPLENIHQQSAINYVPKTDCLLSLNCSISREENKICFLCDDKERFCVDKELDVEEETEKNGSIS